MQKIVCRKLRKGVYAMEYVATEDFAFVISFYVLLFTFKQLMLELWITREETRRIMVLGACLQPGALQAHAHPGKLKKKLSDLYICA
jgi:hypothetical protein